LHLLAFGTLSTSLSLTGRRIQRRILTLSLLIAFAILVETAELIGSTVPFEFSDVRDDLVAALVGYAIAEAFFLLEPSSQSVNRS